MRDVKTRNTEVRNPTQRVMIFCFSRKMKTVVDEQAKPVGDAVATKNIWEATAKENNLINWYFRNDPYW